jgi:hypothetical protein
MPSTAKTSRAIAFGLLLAPMSAAFGQDRTARSMEDCRDRWGGNRDERFCESREVTLAAAKSLTADGRDNGGVTVHGWDKNEIKVVAVVRAEARTEAEARDIAKEVRVLTDGAAVRAEGPRNLARRDSWWVSYEIWVPRQTDLRLMANNGGLSVDGVNSRIDLETNNGGITLTDVDGDVRGSTSNGGVTVELTGDRWKGAGLDLRTSNGGVHLYIPNGYSARLETGTTNGGMDINFPITVQGTIGRRLSTQLGSGGSTIRAITTNGSVSIRRR